MKKLYVSFIVALIYLNTLLPAASGNDIRELNLIETRVCLPGQYSSFGIYNECPESPDGSRIAYVAYNDRPLGNKLVTGSTLWVCDRNLKGHRMVTKLMFRTNNHNGSAMQWVDNNSVAFSAPNIKDGTISVVNVDTGAVEHGPYRGGFLGDNNHGGKILMAIRYKNSNFGEQGIYELDTNNGKIRQIVRTRDLSDYYDKYKWKGNRDFTKWKIDHVKYSTDGSYIAFNVRPYGVDAINRNLFTCKVDGSDMNYWGLGDKPLHYSWFDENTFLGCHSKVFEDGISANMFIKRWDRNKNYLETLAEPGNHVAMSTDENWYAGETGYNSDPIKLFLYKRGSIKSTAVIFEHPFTDMVWKSHGHVNPSFSRDGKRLYYTRAVSNQLKQAYFCDISQIVGGNNEN